MWEDFNWLSRLETRKSQILSPFQNMMEKVGGIPIHLNLKKNPFFNKTSLLKKNVKPTYQNSWHKTRRQCMIEELTIFLKCGTDRVASPDSVLFHLMSHIEA